jgi:polyisoprenyl-phosphate glycosyltransferase
MIIVISLFAGLILVSLGIIAEYLGVAVSMAMGKPAYLIVSRPAGELDRRP